MGEVSPHLYPYIILDVLSHVLIYYIITLLLEGSLKSPYFPAPDVTSRVVPGAVILVLRGGV